MNRRNTNPLGPSDNQLMNEAPKAVRQWAANGPLIAPATMNESIRPVRRIDSGPPSYGLSSLPDPSGYQSIFPSLAAH